MSGGLDIVIKDTAECAEVYTRQLYDRLGAAGMESPIERYFLIALQWVMAGEAVLNPHMVHPVRFAQGSLSEQPLRAFELQVWRQVRALDWPADFVLGTLAADGSRQFAVVECDGHDFHERTKEQAERDRSRDRAVQAQGWRMFRFTGSELYRSAMLLVLDEVLGRWAFGLWAGCPERAGGSL
jgi:very-short-patch-repair endonuclease